MAKSDRAGQASWVETRPRPSQEQPKSPVNSGWPGILAGYLRQQISTRHLRADGDLLSNELTNPTVVRSKLSLLMSKGAPPTRLRWILEDQVVRPNEMINAPGVDISSLADLDVLGDCDCLTFVEHAEPVALFDPEVLDRVLRFIPALHVGLLVHDQGAE
jgi:hypothetical protein